MNMHTMRDECLAVMVFLASVFGVLVPDVRGLFISLESATKLVNETFFVVCHDNGGLPVTWRGPKGLLGPKTRPNVQISSYGTTIIFNHSVIEDTGTYTCTAGNEKKEFHLEMNEPPTFMDKEANQTGTEGHDVTLRCEVSGGIATWLVEGGDISDTSKYAVLGDGLVIKNLSRTDSKTYVCQAVQQSTGVIVNRKIPLKVFHKPSFIHPKYAKLEMAWGYINGTVNLTCIVLSYPAAEFEWFTTVKGGQRRLKYGKVINESKDVSILQLHVDKSTFGNYKCVASNKFGKLEKYFSLEEGAKPQPPNTFELKGANSNVLDLGIQGPENDETTDQLMETKGYRVQFRKAGETSWDRKDFNLTEDNSYLLDNLRHDSAYDVRVATRNAAGLSDYTNASSFRTLTSQRDVASLPCVYHVGVNLIVTLTLAYNLILW